MLYRTVSPTRRASRPGGLSYRKSKTLQFYRRARACPSPCLVPAGDRGGQAPVLRARERFSSARRARECSFVFWPSPCLGARGRSRGTGPRATGQGEVSSARRARECSFVFWPSPCLGARGRSRGTGPRATGPGAVFLRPVGRGPVPRRAET